MISFRVHHSIPGEVIRVQSGDAIGDGPFRVVHECDCGAETVLMDMDPKEVTTLVYRGACRDCRRKRALDVANCAFCKEYPPGSFAPPHMGSPYCRSGSLASGGVNAHCTCDTCF